MEQESELPAAGAMEEEALELTSHCQDVDLEREETKSELQTCSTTATLSLANGGSGDHAKPRDSCIDSLQSSWCCRLHCVTLLRRSWFVQEVFHLSRLAVPAVS